MLNCIKRQLTFVKIEEKSFKETTNLHEIFLIKISLCYNIIFAVKHLQTFVKHYSLCFLDMILRCLLEFKDLCIVSYSIL